jgi:hypothetical protein
MKYWHLSLIDLDMAIEADHCVKDDGAIEFHKEKEDGGHILVGLFAPGFWMSVVELNKEMFEEMIKHQLSEVEGVH